MKTIKINNTDIILQDYEKHGQGKIIISDDWRGSFSYVWGAMGDNISDFICHINESYFADKLCKNTYEFNGKLTARNIRKYFRTEMYGELPYWRFMSAQKELRKEIKKIEGCTNENEFVYMCASIPERIMCLDLSWQEEKEFKEIIEDVFKTEPWHFIGEDLTSEYKWLCELHKKLKKILSKKATE